MARKRITEPQQALPFKSTWGGKRKGAGRPKSKNRKGPEHRSRKRFRRGQPIHVTLRTGISGVNMRVPALFSKVKAILRSAGDRFRTRLVHFSVQRNHLHLIFEAPDWEALYSAVTGLEVRLARMINSLLRRRGRVFDHRYHTHVLTTPSEVRNALVYVLNNARKHARQAGVRLPPSWMDPFSSAAAFDGWKAPIEVHELGAAPPVHAPASWLLKTGWRGRGLISPAEMPVAC